MLYPLSYEGLVWPADTVPVSERRFSPNSYAVFSQLRAWAATLVPC